MINTKSAAYNLTNEGGVGDKTTFIKNIIGLWLIQESRRQWQREGKEYSYAQLEQAALGASPLQSFIDPDAPEFVPQGDLPGRIREFCKNTDQPVPQTAGEIMRCIYQSLALKYRYALEQIQDCTGKSYDILYVVGGGVKDKLLCQMTADSCHCTVSAGPTEATVLGNIAVQLLASGDIKGIADVRRIISRSEKIVRYQPLETDQWDRAYDRFRSVLRT